MFMIGTKPYFFRSEAITVWCDSSVSESTRLACYNVLIVKLVVLLKVFLKCLLIYLLYDKLIRAATNTYNTESVKFGLQQTLGILVLVYIIFCDVANLTSIYTYGPICKI